MKLEIKPYVSVGFVNFSDSMETTLQKSQNYEPYQFDSNAIHFKKYPLTIAFDKENCYQISVFPEIGNFDLPSNIYLYDENLSCAIKDVVKQLDFLEYRIIDEETRYYIYEEIGVVFCLEIEDSEEDENGKEIFKYYDNWGYIMVFSRETDISSLFNNFL